MPLPNRLRSLLQPLALAAGVAAMPAAQAWNAHALCTWPAVEALPQVAGRMVRAESLEQFLAAEGPGVAKLLAEHEAWARKQFSSYAPRPDSLAFAPGPAGEQRSRFLKALRLNVASKLPLFVQLRPGDAAAAGRPRLPWKEVTSLASGVGARENIFAALAEGEAVSAADVLATASAEPDYGLDLGLFADNDTAQGREYGFGAQPFGNPRVDYGTQAPFHMGFYHEARIVFAAAGFLQRTRPEERVALFMALAQHAFATGHAYWGWRFGGWALHYVQDLTQPYHARVLPGVGVTRMLAVNGVAMAGWQGPKNDAIALVTNRHTVVENYQFRRLQNAFDKGLVNDNLLAALRDTRADASAGSAEARFELAQVRGRITTEAAEAADELDAQLERSFPARYTADPSISLGNEGDQIDMVQVAHSHSPTEAAALSRVVAARLARLGVYTRALVRTLANRQDQSRS